MDVSVELRVAPARQSACSSKSRRARCATNSRKRKRGCRSSSNPRASRSPTSGLDQETARYNALIAQLAMAQAERVDLETRQRNTGSEVSPDVLQSPGVINLKSQIASAETKLSEISSIVGKNHPQRQQLEAQIGELKRQLAAETRRVAGGATTSSRGSSQKVNELQIMVDMQKKQLLSMRSDRDQIAVYQRDVDAAQRAYDAVTQRLGVTNLEGLNNQANTRLPEPRGRAARAVAAADRARHRGVDPRRPRPRHPRRARHGDDGPARAPAAGPDRRLRSSGDRRAQAAGLEAADLPAPPDDQQHADARARSSGDPLMKTAVSMLGTPARATRTLGAILIDGGQLKPEDAERVLQYQKQQNLRFGEAALRLGLISEADIQFALSRQFAYAYLRRTPGEMRPLSDELVAAYQPFSTRVEQLRAIRSQLMLRWFDRAEERQVLTVVGAERGEGRSYLAANLAIVFSQLGERTLLVDADMREPRQHFMFHLENQIGFSTLLAGRSREEAIVRISDLAGLSVLPAGPTPPNPLELLNRLNFDEFMIQAKTAYDVIIVDTPAMTSGEDAAMIAVRTGAALAVARSGSTRVAAYTDLVQGLMDAGVAVVGSVLNEVPLRNGKKKLK
jgi:receptor protein-tyrosine kinase